MINFIFYFKKAKNNLKRNLKQYRINKKYFNKEIARAELFSNLSYYLPLLNNPKWNKIKNDLVYDYLINNYSHIINKYRNVNDFQQKKMAKKIWIFWYQGIEDAPIIVKKCIESIQKYKNDYEVIILNKDNYTDYANLPEKLINKVKNGKITLAHFSDILRANLLSRHGGIWIDSTCYLYNDVVKKYDECIFNTAANSKNKWTGFFLGGSSNVLFNFCNEFLIEYNLSEDVLIDYFLLDYILKIAYIELPICRQIIELANINSKNIHFLDSNFNKIYSEKEYAQEVETSSFQKLTYKKIYKKKIKNKLTYYGWFMKDDN